MLGRVTAAATTFPAESASVPTARRFVRATLEEWGLRAAWEAAEMLVSEVVTNAVLHARTEFTVEVLRADDVVRVSVRDRSATVPRQRAYGTDATTGRGLRLVASLAVAWGVDRYVGGKTVWFEVLSIGDAGTAVEPWAADADQEAVLAGFADLDEDVPRMRLGGRPGLRLVEAVPGAAA
jgi:anti-sigma regulatory factor (Ser/Thr protein kinase)